MFLYPNLSNSYFYIFNNCFDNSLLYIFLFGNLSFIGAIILPIPLVGSNITLLKSFILFIKLLFLCIYSYGTG